MSSEIPPLANRRPGPRKRAYLGCTIVHGEAGAYSFPCVIRDIAPGGVRISFAAGLSLPANFWLIDSRARIAHKGRVAWSNPREAGVEFESSFAMQALPAEFSYLKRFAGR